MRFQCRSPSGPLSGRATTSASTSAVRTKTSQSSFLCALKRGELQDAERPHVRQLEPRLLADLSPRGVDERLVGLALAAEAVPLARVIVVGLIRRVPVDHEHALAIRPNTART